MAVECLPSQHWWIGGFCQRCGKECQHPSWIANAPYREPPVVITQLHLADSVTICEICHCPKDCQTTSPAEEDASVIDALRVAGADLLQPREVLHYFFVRNKEQAEHLAAELRRDGFRVENPVDAHSVLPWVGVFAEIIAVVNLESAEKTTSRFRALASRFGGKYDGWEAAETP